MRDYVGACRACFDAFAKGHGRYDGEFYQLRRPAFQPGAEPDVSPPPIYLAAVNPFMTAIAGECADGLAAHPFTTEHYLDEVMQGALRKGAERAGRPAPPVLLQLVVAPDRETAAKQMIAYTVPAYRRVLDHAGLGAAADAVMAASKEGRRIEARTIIEERYLDLLGVTTLQDLSVAVERWGPHCDRLSLSVPWFGMTDREQLVFAHEVVEAVAATPAT
jgi:alkanesulfonate monooxygenase SsuD/methylene tetrahydromethanopterin reductase-like flavin-dependent oxidoreductase (luciferase family)